MSSTTGAERRPWSLAARLTAWYAAAAFALVLAATGYLYWALAGNLDREDDQFLADEVADVRRVLDERTGDRAALRQEVLGGGGSGRDSGRLFVRVESAGQTVETPGMGAILPGDVFPRPTAGSELAGEYRTADGRSFRLRAYAAEPRPYRIQVAMDTSHDDELLEDFRRRLSYVLGLSLLAAAVGGYRIARRGLRPIADVTATARRIRPAHLDERLVTAGLPAEVRDLADTFNHMLDRLADAFARLGRFAADIAHELRSPVNNLRAEAEVALGRPRTEAEYREVLGSCLEECGRLARLIDGMLFLARAEDPRTELATEAVDAAGELAAVREFYAPSAAEAGVRVDVEAAAGLVVRADRVLFQRAVGNLVANALAHTPAGGAVTLFADRSADGVRVGVRDTGSGIPAEHLPYVFDRFYRADAARSPGTGRVGLGLAIVRAIAELHGGTAEAASPPGQGTTVTLHFPTKEP